MQIAPTYISVAVLFLAHILPMFGITIGTPDLQTTIQTLVDILVPLFIMFRQYVTRRSTLLGTRPQ